MIYKTFAFTLAPENQGKVMLRGEIRARDGAGLASEIVTVIENGKAHLTATNAKGEFAFYGRSGDAATVYAHKMRMFIPKIQVGNTIVLRAK